MFGWAYQGSLPANISWVLFSQIVGLWWAGFIISNIVANVAFRMANNNSGIEELISYSRVEIVSNFLDIATAMLAIMMIRRASEMEEALYNNITTIHDEEGEHILGFVGEG